LLQALFREIRKDPTIRKLLSPVEITLATSSRCLECGHTELHTEESDFLILSLGSAQSSHNLKDLVENYFSEQYVEYHCGSCLVHGVATL